LEPELEPELCLMAASITAAPAPQGKEAT